MADEMQAESKHDDDIACEHVLSAAEALERIRNGDKLHDVRISRLEFNGDDFEHDIELVNCTLISPRIDKAVFNHRVAFVKCQIKNMQVRQSTFNQGFGLNSSSIRRANFGQSTINGNLRFDGAVTEQSVRFDQCSIEKIRTWNTRFTGWFEFHETEFSNLADFRSFSADEGIVFENCKFVGDALFRGALVAKKLDFGDSRFEQFLDLSKAKLHDFVYLEGIEQGPKQSFAFANAVAEHILITPEQLDGRIKSEVEGSHAGSTQEYGLLKRNFEALHRYEEEDWALYRFKVSQRRAKERTWSKPWTKVLQFADWLFLDLGCGYGTNPFRAIAAALVILLLFVPMYMVGIDNFQVDTALVGTDAHTTLNHLVFSLVTSISVFTAGFTGDQLYNAKGWVLFPLAFEALLGTLLWGFFIVAFSRKVIR